MCPPRSESIPEKIEEDRPRIRTTLTHLDTVTSRLEPLLENFRKTTDEANKTLDHIDSLIGENRADVHQAVLELRRTLVNTTELTAATIWLLVSEEQKSEIETNIAPTSAAMVNNCTTLSAMKSPPDGSKRG